MRAHEDVKRAVDGARAGAVEEGCPLPEAAVRYYLDLVAPTCDNR